MHPFRSLLLVTCLALGACVTPAAHETGPSGYNVEHGWPVLPDGFALSVSGGVAVGSAAGDPVYSIHSGGREWPDRNTPELIDTKTIMAWDPQTGELLRAFGDNRFRMTHSLTVDGEGNLWAPDVGLHQVFKFSPDGELLMALGEPGVSGDTPGHFNMPTDVAVTPEGSFYVSDGYGNNRIIKYSAAGEYEFEWGSAGSGPGEFNLPHSIALDRLGRVYVADRGNKRIQIFTPDGKYVDEIRTEGWMPYALQISADDRLFVTDGGDKPAKYPFRSRVVVMTLGGNILETFGRYGNYDGQFLLAHDIALGPDGAVYVADVLGSRVQKFTK